MRRKVTSCFQAKDFIQTKEGLVFAVVEQGLENGKVLCFLRYQKLGISWQKLATSQANQLLKIQYPQYLFYSQVKSANLHAVSVADISIHHQPRQRLQLLLAKPNPDKIEQDFIDLCQLFQEQGVKLNDLGVTGSLLLGAQNSNSDIDLVVYGRKSFYQLRELIRLLIVEDKLQQLDESAWLDSYQRRSCDLSYDDYVWHEQRKYNKALIQQRKFDLNLIERSAEQESISYQKQGAIIIRARVIDAQYAFDYPARFIIEHQDVAEVVCYTATYTGQAEQGEFIEVSGQLEVSSAGMTRILVGSTREAEGEYIKVVAHL
ncbi:hypothetical protein BMR07_07305 [Methylococcaceae bacterium CS1]|nr:nucleotidyltransferase domain-containing protein [Methyloprofundus sp.]TXK96393.1 hypothetical protein BMR10_07795 [Methylococcaceae bacterium CS4]TXK97119.1 hypothetical protein BMR11_10830 [Methylococcaceae bacterium CS5]TXL06008.1 hypothetical protein BMR09_08845 [Methylococcaceae bacterium CS3]TXL06333.1 hypothetical protein BMR07_07305 [Methylococcaceae bacterium CS1]TXL11646.1 hypothetical protein BMR08_03700 [Methylococcaceae bacterium CS2]